MADDLCSKTLLSERTLDSADLLSSIVVGEVIAEQYEVLAEIGSGSWGVVYKARQRELDRIVAIKVLRRDLLSDKSKLLRFKQEALAVSKLCHRNVLQVVDYGVADRQQPYCVMEYFESQSLDLFVQCCTDGAVLRDVLLQTLAALSYAHGEGIIHRDVKPGNILVARGEDGELLVKLVDFGIARLCENEDNGLTATGELLGTPLYMSPEQCNGDEIDQRSDLYSLGCVIYEAVSGYAPFQANNSFECMLKHLREAPSLLRYRDGRPVDGALQNLLNKALSKSKEDRFESADSMAAALAETKFELVVGNAKPSRKRSHSVVPIICALIACLGLAFFCKQFFAPSAVPLSTTAPINGADGYLAESYTEELRREVRDLAQYAADLRNSGNEKRSAFIEKKLSELKALEGTEVERSGPELCLVSIPEGKPTEKFSDKSAATVRVSGTGAPVDLILCGASIAHWKLVVSNGTKIRKVYVWGYETCDFEGLPEGVQTRFINDDLDGEEAQAPYQRGVRDEHKFRRYIRHLLNRDIDSMLFADDGTAECLVGPGNPQWTARVLLSKIVALHDEATAYNAAQVRKRLKNKQFWAMLHRPVVSPGYRGNPDELSGTHQIALFDFEGPIKGTALKSPTNATAVAGDVSGPVYYRGDSFVKRLDLKTKQATVLTAPPHIPDPSQAEFLAFDSSTGNLYGVSGYIEAYNGLSKKWSVRAELDLEPDYHAHNGVAYDPVDKCFYILPDPIHPYYYRYLYKFGMDGKVKGRIRLSQPVRGSDEYAFRQQLIYVDGVLVSITPPFSTRESEAQALMYVIEPRTGKVLYSGKMREH
ncbi:MAG: serine/threonine protein kinase [Candidatus Obscuribacterales bacterium]|nr:serine/threonine protein kinase [Candidatus Obscuribacterales bacterium]